MRRGQKPSHISVLLSLAFSSKETSEVLAVPRNRHISLLRFAVLLFLCLLQAGEPTDAGRHRACLGRGSAALPGSPSPADISSVPVLPSSSLCIPHMGLHPLDPIPQPPGAFCPGGSFTRSISRTGRHPPTGKQQQVAGTARHALRQGSAQAAAAPNQPGKCPAVGLLPAAPGPID